MDPLDHHLVKSLMAAMTEYDVLEPWLTESQLDDGYWAEEARAVITLVPASPSGSELRDALVAVLANTFGALESDNGLFRDNLDARLDLIVARALVKP